MKKKKVVAQMKTREIHKMKKYPFENYIVDRIVHCREKNPKRTFVIENLI